jgi:hypothetical protein
MQFTTIALALAIGTNPLPTSPLSLETQVVASKPTSQLDCIDPHGKIEKYLVTFITDNVPEKTVWTEDALRSELMSFDNYMTLEDWEHVKAVIASGRRERLPVTDSPNYVELCATDPDAPPTNTWTGAPI